MFWFLILPLYCSASLPQIQEIRVDSVTEAINPNLVPNFSFEDVEDSVPKGWRWDPRNTDATMMVDEDRSHTGKRSVRFQNTTSFGAHVYGTLWTDPAIPVKPETDYTLSFYAYSESPGVAWVGGGKGWRVRVHIRSTGGVWRRFSQSFATGKDETSFEMRVITESPTEGFWVDDIKLEEGAKVTLCEPPPEHKGLVLSSPEWPSAMPDGPWEGYFDIYSSESRSVRIQASITQGEHTTTHRADSTLSKDLSRVRIVGEAVEPTDEPCTLSLSVLDSANLSVSLADASVQLRFLSIPDARSRLEALSTEAKKLNEMVDQLREKGVDPAYPLVGVTVVSDFIQYVKQDLDRGDIERAFDQLRQMESIAKNVHEKLQSAIDGEIALPEVPRYVTSPITIEGPSFIAETRLPVSGITERRPVFFTGYGHFNQVRSDLEKFPGYGTNIIQIELGPRHVFPDEGRISDETINSYLRDFDRAAEAGISVCLLISPHYMPGWMLDKYPQLRIQRRGFLGYCLHAPEGQEFLKSFIHYLIPKIYEHPALHSICLTNEPINSVPTACNYARKEWQAWLRERHGDIDRLNKLWGSGYASFEDIPIPEDRIEPAPFSYEFVLFNQEWFAGWHRMLADAIHEVAPDLPVHAKAMTWNFFSQQDLRFGVNAELFAGFSQINGNDSINFYSHGLREWSQGWILNNSGHDLQRSVGDMPVFNSENHIIVDRETLPIPPGHVRTALWQAAIHGQSATTIWVWGRSYDPKSDIAGSIMHRPACVEAVGRTGLDLLRLSREVTAIQALTPDIGLLYSTTAMVYDGGDHTDCRDRLYLALSFTGLKIGFVTERQLISGKGSRPPVLLVPNISHLSEEAFASLAKYPGRVVLVGGESLLKWDAYNRPRESKLDCQRIDFSRDGTEAQELWKILLDNLSAWGIAPSVRVTNNYGEPVWGVEWLSADQDGRTIVNLIQHGKEPAQVMISHKGKPFRGDDLFSQEEVEGNLELKPLTPRILSGE